MDTDECSPLHFEPGGQRGSFPLRLCGIQSIVHFGHLFRKAQEPPESSRTLISRPEAFFCRGMPRKDWAVKTQRDLRTLTQGCPSAEKMKKKRVRNANRMNVHKDALCFMVKT